MRRFYGQELHPVFPPSSPYLTWTLRGEVRAMRESQLLEDGVTSCPVTSLCFEWLLSEITLFPSFVPKDADIKFSYILLDG